MPLKKEDLSMMGKDETHKKPLDEENVVADK
jgi:hypothetical protein